LLNPNLSLNLSICVVQHTCVQGEDAALLGFDEMRTFWACFSVNKDINLGRGLSLDTC